LGGRAEIAKRTKVIHGSSTIRKLLTTEAPNRTRDWGGSVWGNWRRGCTAKYEKLKIEKSIAY